MGERSDQIERHIDATRTELRHDVKELEHKVRTATDWRAQFQKHPGVFIAGGFAVGALIAMMVPDRRRAGKARAPQGSGTRYQVEKAYAMWDSIKGALVAVSAIGLRRFLQETIPGFAEHYTATEQHARQSQREERERQAPEQSYGSAVYDRAAGF